MKHYKSPAGIMQGHFPDNFLHGHVCMLRHAAEVYCMHGPGSNLETAQFGCYILHIEYRLSYTRGWTANNIVFQKEHTDEIW